MGGNRHKKVNSNIKSVCKSKRKPKSPGSVKSDLSGISVQCLGGSPTILNSPLRHSNSVNKLLCVPGCSYGGRQGNAEMFKCCLCMQWVHPSAVAIQKMMLLMVESIIALCVEH